MYYIQNLNYYVNQNIIKPNDLQIKEFKKVETHDHYVWWSQKWSLIDSLVGAYDEVTIPAKMREKDTGVVLANSSPMIKLIEFSISLRE